MSHTPGPWRVHGDGIGVGQSPSGQFICRAAEVFMSRGEREANARLIAAAPELLEACKGAMRIRSLWAAHEDSDPDEGAALHVMLESLQNAIAKATGETP